MSLFFRQKKQQKVLAKKLSLHEASVLIQERLYEYTGGGSVDVGLDSELRRSREAHQRMVSSCIRTCCSGKLGAKEIVKELIYEFCRELFPEREDYLELLPFDVPEKMTAWQQLEALIFLFDKEKENHGFEILCEKFQWNKNGFNVSKEVVNEAYQKIIPKFSEKEERKILVQIIFAVSVGLGKIDILNQQKGFIEEIQIGMSGKTERQYDYKNVLYQEKDTFSRDGIYIMARGNVFKLSAISFDSEEEQQRVLRNLIKDGRGGELTVNHPMLVVDTVDGRRVSVSRPPATENWVGLIRKFDTVTEVSLEKLYAGYSEEKLLPELLRQLVHSGRNIAITGEMASGKTTLFRACLTETKKNLNIRVIESDSFELNIRNFLPQANSMTIRVSEHTPAEEVLAFARKTTGQIFAVGEINSASVAVMAMDLSKIASQLFFSAHYINTEHMIADFTNAKLCAGGYSEESLAEADAVRCLGFDVHMTSKGGRRYVQYVNEILPSIVSQGTVQKAYVIRPIYVYDEEKEQGRLINPPGKESYEQAKQRLEKEEYLEFVRFFEKQISEDMPVWKEKTG